MVNNKLCLLWQNVITRQWYHIGNLSLTDNNNYIFTYENGKARRGLNDALKNGYVLHPSFRERYKKYESKRLFAAFSRRLPNKNRKDYEEILKRLSLNTNATDFELLLATGGKLVSDNYEFVKPISFNGNIFELEFYVRGWRHYVDEANNNVSDSAFSLKREPDNNHDTHAVEVYNGEVKVGYVPAFYSNFVYDFLTETNEYQIENFTFNPEEPSRFKLKLRMSGCIDESSLIKYSTEMLVAL